MKILHSNVGGRASGDRLSSHMDGDEAPRRVRWASGDRLNSSLVISVGPGQRAGYRSWVELALLDCSGEGMNQGVPSDEGMNQSRGSAR